MNKDKFILDQRNIEDIEKQFVSLAHSYTPEWFFSKENPDIGSTIGIIFVKQMMENIKRFNGCLTRWQCEYLKLLNITAKSAQPARMLAVFDAVPGQDFCYIKKGTPLVISTAFEETGEDRILFETLSKLCVVSSKLDYVIITGKKRFLENVIFSPSDEWKPIDFNKDYLVEQEHKMIGLLHRNAFSVFHRPLNIHIKSNIDFGSALEKGDYKLLYRTANGMEPVTVLKAKGDKVTVFFENEPKVFSLTEDEIDEDTETFSELIIEQVKPSDKQIEIHNIEFKSSGHPYKPDYICAAGVQSDVNSFYMFGKKLEVYSECLIGYNDYFNQAGSRITMSFQLTYETCFVNYQPDKEEELKVIKRRNKNETAEVIADAFVQNIQFEYYSDNGWKRLETDDHGLCQKLFATGQNEGTIAISFICPMDWRPSDEAGYYGRTLKIQLLESRYCYYQPCRHHVPVIKHLQIEYSYDNAPAKPQYCIRYNERDCSTQISKWNNGINIAFSPLIIEHDALYLGFDYAPKRGPVSIFFKISKNKYATQIPLRFEYSSKDGYKQISVIDNTEGGKKSGTIEFMPPEDFVKARVAGVYSYFLRIIDSEGILSDFAKQKPIIEKIHLNAVWASNLHTQEPQEFYIDVPRANMEFDLGTQKIYDTIVMVNNDGVFEQWTETDDFEYSESKKVYKLDRNNSRIIFGDGKLTDFPCVTDDVAFTVACRYCNGTIGNVDAHSIDKSLEHFGMISDIYNPYPAYGGTDEEALSQTKERGMHILSSSNRLITKKDYEREVLSFSDSITRVHCYSDDNGNINIVILVRDFLYDNDNFEQIKENLHDHLMKNCELTISSDKIHICEPVFAKITVQLWLKVISDVDSFELKDKIIATLNEYLNSVTGNNGNGWDIGEIPSKEQIIMKLKFMKNDAIVNNCIITAKYNDESGTHELPLEKIVSIPNVVIDIGEHEVYTEWRLV